MTTPPFAHVEAVFRSIRPLPVGERKQALDDACGKDALLRRAVEAMLRHDSGRHALLDAPVADLSAWTEPETDRAGEVVGDFTLRDEIGSGGMGVVYRAEQASPKRDVAVKLIHPLLVSPQGLARLRREAAVLARMDHPGVAMIIEAGTHEAHGRRQPYIAMELVDGVPLTTWAAEHPDARLELLIELADAIGHAHARGIVHRDLKPANVLVTPAGRVKVLDFGAARLVTAEVTRSVATEAGQIIGTVPFMSPEQFRADPDAIGPTADVYALGVLTYRLLTGHLPLDLGGRPIAEAARIAQDEEPTRLGAIDRRWRGDLETIVATALAKDPARRYPDARAFRDDLRRYRAKETIAARPPSALYRFRKVTERNRGLFAGLGAAFAVLAVATVVSMVLFLEAQRESTLRAAEANRADAEALRADALRTRAEIDADRANLAAAEALIRAGDVASARSRLARIPDGRREWGWQHLDARCDDSLGILFERRARMLGLDVSHDGRLVAWTGSNELTGVLDLATGKETSLELFGELRSVAFAPDGRALAIGGFKATGVWPFASAASEFIALEAIDQVRDVTALGGGRYVTGDTRRGLICWDGASGVPVEQRNCAPGEVLLGSERNGIFPCVEQDTGWVLLLDAGTFAERGRFRVEGIVMAIDLRPDGGEVVVGTYDGHLVVVDTKTRATRAWAAHADIVTDVTYIDDVIVSASEDNGLAVWRPADGTLVRRLHGHEDRVRRVVPHPSRPRTFLSCADDGAVRIWSLDAPANPIIRTLPARARRVAFSPDGRSLATGGRGKSGLPGRVHRWSTADGTLDAELTPALGEVYGLLFTQNGRLVAAGADRLAVWDPGTTDAALVIDDVGIVHAMGADDEWAAAVTFRGRLIVIRLRDGKRMIDTSLEFGGVCGLWWEAPGETLVLVSYTGVCARFDVRTGKPTVLTKATKRKVLAAGRDPVHGRLVLAQADGTLLFVDSSAASPDFRPAAGGAVRGIRSVRWSPDERWLLTVGDDRQVQLRDPDTGRLHIALSGHERFIDDAAFSPDSSTLASVAADGTLRIWRLAALAESRTGEQ